MNAMIASNSFYADIYISMGLFFIGSAFLLWLGMRVTSVLVERNTDNPIAKGLAVLFGLAVGFNLSPRARKWLSCSSAMRGP